MTDSSNWFLAGGGAMGELLRTHDWAPTPFGPPSRWPYWFRSALSTCINSPSAFAIYWGPDFRLLYNDSYVPFLGSQHPWALGRATREIWPDTWESVTEAAQRVWSSGEGLLVLNERLMLDRGAGPVETFWHFRFAPIRSELGVIEGVTVSGFDNTGQVQAEQAQARQRERQHLMLQQMPGFAALLVGPEHRYEFVNDAYVAVAGARDFIGHSVREVFPELEGQNFFELLDGVYATGKPYAARALPIHLQREAGDRFVDLLYEPLRNDAGAITGIFVGGYDVTERIVAEAELRRSEARLRALEELSDRLRVIDEPADLPHVAAEILGRALEVSRVGYGTIDDTTDTLRVERDWTAPGVESLAGVTPLRDYGSFIESLKRDEFVAIQNVREDERTAFAAQALEKRSARSFVNVPVVEHGRLVAVLYVNHFEAREWKQDELALIKEVAARTRDTLQRRRNEVALRASEAQFRAFAQAMPNHVWAARPDGDLYWFNDQVYAYSGGEPGSHDGDAWAAIVHPEDLANAAAAWQHSLATGETYETEFRIRRHDASYRWFLVRAEPVRAADGRITNWVGTNTDIDTARRQAGELVNLNATLEQQVQQRTAALMATEAALRQSQKMEAVGQLTGGIAHDFNNLLAGISGSLEMMQTRLAQGRVSDIDRYMIGAQGATKRAAALTHRLLAFSRQQTLDPKPTDMNRLVAGMEEMIRRAVGPAIELETVAQGGLWSTSVDPNQLENALLNLCINARDAMPDGGRITIETGNRWLDERTARERDLAPGQYVSMCVSDNGTGMTTDVIEKAFDPFFTTKPIGVGTGLGLSMIYGFARQSGGQVRIYSEVGAGTMVCLYLPRYVGGDTVELPLLPVDNTGRVGAGETVLVIDDEPLVRMLVVDILDELGYIALEAGDGPDGMKVVRSDVRIDLLITDVGLPNGMNGRQVAEAARAVRPGLKVLFVTGYAENAALSHGHLDQGMQVVTKPFDMPLLASRIKTMIAGE